MSGDKAAAGESTLEGVPKQARLALLALVAVAQAIPGLALLSAEDWYPPGLGAAAFAVVAAVAGAGVVGLVFIGRRRVQRLRARVLAALCGAALLLSLLLMAGYRATLDVRVVTYEYDGSAYRELVPFGTTRWVNAELLRRVRTVNRPAPSSASAVRPSHMIATLQEYGPAYVQKFYRGWHVLTVGVLWSGYLAVLSLLAGAFALAAVRLGHELGVAAPKAQGAESPAPPTDPRSPAAPVPAADGWERRVAELEEELRRVRVQVENGHATHPSRNGRPREPLVVRAEIRTSGWLLLGAAALAWWIGKGTPGRDSRRETERSGAGARER